MTTSTLLNNTAFKSFNEADLEKATKALASQAVQAALAELKLNESAFLRAQEGYKAINKKSFFRTLKLLASIGKGFYESKALSKHMEALFVALHTQQKENANGEFQSMSEMYMTNKEIQALVNKLSRNEDTSVQYAFKDALTVSPETITAKLGNDKYLLNVLELASVDKAGIKLKRNTRAYHRILKMIDKRINQN